MEKKTTFFFYTEKKKTLTMKNSKRSSLRGYLLKALLFKGDLPEVFSIKKFFRNLLGLPYEETYQRSSLRGDLSEDFSTKKIYQRYYLRGYLAVAFYVSGTFYIVEGLSQSFYTAEDLSEVFHWKKIYQTSSNRRGPFRCRLFRGRLRGFCKQKTIWKSPLRRTS